MTRQRARPHPRTATCWLECPGPARVSRPPGWLVFVVGGAAWPRQRSPAGHKLHSAPISAPCGAFRLIGGKLYSRTPERRTAPRRGLSARAGTPRGGFCNTTRAGVSGHDNARGFYDAIMRGWLAPQNLTKPKIQPEMPPRRAEHGIKPNKLYQLKAGNTKTHFSLACQ